MTHGGSGWGNPHAIEYTLETLPERLQEGIAWAESAIAEAEQLNNAEYRSCVRNHLAQ